MRPVPVIARMRLRGLPFDPAMHAQTVDKWQAAYAEGRQSFTELTGTDVPATPAQTRAWLEERLTTEVLKDWKRSKTGLLSRKASELTR
jgi:hypothetical protein